MFDVTIIGGGTAANSCYEVLSHAGLRVTRTFELESGDNSAVILGETHSAYQTARQAVETGRHILIASPQVLSPQRLSLLLENRKHFQAIFVWSERRYHPGYRLLNGLTEADSTWRPRFLRSETLSTESSNPSLFRLRTLEAIGLVVSIASSAPISVAARAAANAKRNSFDLLNLEISFADLNAFLQVGLGEATERRETLLAASSRKAYIDELNQTTPVRLVDDDPGFESGNTRWLACPSPSNDELARQQCISFLSASLKPKLAEQEAQLWHRSLDIMAAMERSMRSDGIAVPISEPAGTVAGRKLSLVLPNAA